MLSSCALCSIVIDLGLKMQTSQLQNKSRRFSMQAMTDDRSYASCMDKRTEEDTEDLADLLGRVMHELGSALVG